jgi:hypothetical protein
MHRRRLINPWSACDKRNHGGEAEMGLPSVSVLALAQPLSTNASTSPSTRMLCALCTAMLMSVLR